MEESILEEKIILRAHADMVGQGVTGSADFVEIKRGTQILVKVTLDIKGDPAVFISGEHGVHIHEKGVCELPNFMSAGGHFDPGPAGNADPDVNHPYHMGDLPNIEVKEDGSGRLEAISSRITLSPGPLSIFDSDGASIMVHAKHDPGMGGPHKSGVSGGPRLACGVIKLIS